jgi:signal transduction protein with GAF and PtsI domain
MQPPLEQSRARLESLSELNQRLMSPIEPDALLQAVLDSVIRLFAVEGCSIGMVDETRRRLAFIFAGGRAKVEECRIALGQGIAGWVAQPGQGVSGFRTRSLPRCRAQARPATCVAVLC